MNRGTAIFVMVASLLVGTQMLLGCRDRAALEAEIASRFRGEVRTIEGCEYAIFISTTYYGYDVVSATHKGNCKNPIHTCENGAKR